MGEINTVTYGMLEAGSRMSMDLIAARLSYRMGGVCGVTHWRDWLKAKGDNKDLATMYAEGQIEAAEAIYTAMERARVGRKGERP